MKKILSLGLFSACLLFSMGSFAYSSGYHDLNIQITNATKKKCILIKKSAVGKFVTSPPPVLKPKETLTFKMTESTWSAPMVALIYACGDGNQVGLDNYLFTEGLFSDASVKARMFKQTGSISAHYTKENPSKKNSSHGGKIDWTIVSYN